MYRAAASRILSGSKSAFRFPTKISTTSSTIKSSTSTSTSASTTRNRFFSAANESSKKPKKTFVEWYEGHLQERPVLTKMCTGCVLWGVGDAVAQIVPHYAAETEEGREREPLEYDFPRTGRAVLYGFALHAPASHVHFNFLEWMTQKGGFKGLQIPIFKTFMEQFVYWGYISNALYLAAMGALQFHSPEQIYNKIKDSLWGLMLAQWAFWIPVQALNFQFVPVRHQLNVVLTISIIWTALLSFWYPPEPKPMIEATPTEEKKEDKK